MSDSLSPEQKEDLRKKIILLSSKLIGIKYVYGTEWKNFSEIPTELDCSELVEGCFNHYGLKMPDGSQNQFNFTVPTATPQCGDLGFFGRSGKTDQIYHVGIVYSEKDMIEVRGYDPDASFPTGKVILRIRERWEKFPNFVGYRTHPKL